ncbi:MAG: hypothetical protein HWQ38_24230 [Nostoc sp. NMS7]|uniref:hypothetical protein n=1 Tax=Nostoc sp. NMS7 TaxID=2815391 RepID=UPI0025F6779C|nr:hypothetical protein [Nostoc sp. NMS7]MBN3949402.1 hypothetical protein [Nostoc sp. NMS7]
MNFVRIGCIFSVLTVFGFGHTAVAQQVEEAAKPICYMQAESGKIINLGSLCGDGMPASVSQQNDYVGGSSSTKRGNCQYSWQFDSSVKACGDRSASSRSGYSDSPSYAPSYSGSNSGTYVHSYTRSNGTFVEGYHRR